ncbi:MAG TPA: carbohydrate kinase family protein, partial [Vicinamibacterales bacterium]
AAGRELKTPSMVRSPGAGALITAVAAARLGTRCAVISALSPDSEELLRKERVTVRNLRARGEPSAVTVALSTRADRRFVTFEGINGDLPSRIRGVLPRVRARHVHFAFVPRPCAPWVRVVARLRRRGVTTSWDFGWDDALARDPELWPLAMAVDLLFVNRNEAVLYGRRPRFPAAVTRWRSAGNHIVIKLGVAGARVVGGGIDVRMPAHRTHPAVDSTGAGDAFDGGFLAALLRGHSIRQALVVGNRLGALSVRRPGGIAGLPRASGRS